MKKTEHKIDPERTPRTPTNKNSLKI